MDIQAVYRNFERQWATHRVDYDHTFGFQCVDLIKQYVHQEFKLKPGSWGDALAYWNSTPPELLDHFEKINTNSPHMGDIVILNICHIGIATGTVFAETFQMLDQNGGATHNGSGIGDDSIQVHTFARSHIAGVLRAKNAHIGPVQAVASVPKYQVVETYNPGKKIRLNKQPTYLWGMNYDFNYMKDHPIQTHNRGEVWTVVNKVHHEDGYDYYRREGQVDGFNVVDCDDYVPPAPYVAPQGAATMQKAETYTLVTALPYYGSPDDAQNSRNQLGVLPATSYFVWGKAGANNSYYNLTSNNMKNLEHWVNILDNKPPVEIAAKPVSDLITTAEMNESEIRATYRDIFANGAPLAVVAKTNLSVADILGRANVLVPIKKGQDFSVYGTFKKNDQWYIMPKLKMSDRSASDFMFGIPINNERTLEPFLEDLYGFPEQLRYGVAVWYDKLVNSLEGIFRAKTKK